MFLKRKILSFIRKTLGINQLRQDLIDEIRHAKEGLDVDFENTTREIGERKIPSVGMSFVGVQAAFVVTNHYMDTIVDFNKSSEGIETEVVGENTISNIDARKALAYLKLKMRGVN